MFTMGVLKLYLMTMLCVAFVKAQPITQDFTVRYTNSPYVQGTTTMFPGVLFYTTSRFNLMVNSTSITGLKNPSSATATKNNPKAKNYTLFVVFPVLTVNGFVSLRGSLQTSSVTLLINNVRFSGTRDDTKRTVTGSIIVDQINVPTPPCRAPPNAPGGLNDANTCGGLFTSINTTNRKNFLVSQLVNQVVAAISYSLNVFFNYIT